MTRDELEKLESIRFGDEVPLLTEIYVVVDEKNHESGYRILNIYGCNQDNTFAKKISGCSDVIHFNFEVKNIDYLKLLPFSVDSLECNVIRYFVHNPRLKFKVGLPLSDFYITVVEER